METETSHQSSKYSFSDSTIATGAWTPDDQQVENLHYYHDYHHDPCLQSDYSQVYVATGQGGLIVMDVHGNIVSKVHIHSHRRHHNHN